MVCHTLQELQRLPGPARDTLDGLYCKQTINLRQKNNLRQKIFYGHLRDVSIMLCTTSTIYICYLHNKPFLQKLGPFVVCNFFFAIEICSSTELSKTVVP